MIIAIDAMGGDLAPSSNIEGAIEAAREMPDIRLVLVGDEARLTPMLAQAPTNIEIRHASEIIEADEEPVKAVRRKRDSSLVVGVTMVKNKEADVIISAGNTGAFMTAALLITGRIKGIDRPALSPIVPTVGTAGAMILDAGANMDAHPKNLLQYAIMGSIYAKKVMGVESPRIGLLNVGTEERKGNDLTKETYGLLQESSLNFIGNVEARDVMEHVCDVVVCDGFSGNILLKTMEGMAKTMMSVMKEEFTRTVTSQLAAMMLRPGLKRMKMKMDYAEHGGALLMGVQGTCIKAHGSSSARAIYTAIKQAKKFVEQDVNGLIAREIQGESGDSHV
ncbi:phosphate acyltransferase [Aneurinibacillus migulanus]|uniref:phosphate acyltransferase PlsX n=1 Tax=Aneurinibacillus migulanus TaxID=47500 RepID=UPI0005B7BC6F|nr:phosphate acyltransferase PlsX [Aneurinibacillus migulanus]KIV50385.1 phosphate acyltransferase [Aneurinibacillus migulanus]KPD06439.1 phosphate acyltransferase [Aneurinibacillus migulanus]MCP1355631.1 phosphate acyltransferase PlsX [Aneurinibacillus migulanus]CEH32034.1 Phosphate acyltransferase (EC 2.3.1.n2) (Acyl-ACP phosphotransacylase) (Acyl-[acyl-carrier-protein]--phosphat e acyltransferase) (Phosphate-acyl-ACP acyltransferase) [Aneurinibacillus migulanus]